MKDIENLFDKAVTEIERMLNSKTVVGEPITVEGNTLIPLINVGFGFGGGGGKGTEANKGSGQGGGTGGGGGVKTRPAWPPSTMVTSGPSSLRSLTPDFHTSGPT